MSIEAAIKEHLAGSTPLTAIVGTRIFFDSIPQSNTTYPCCAVQIVSEVRSHHLTAFDGTASSRFQISCFDTNPVRLLTITAAIANRMDGFRGTFGTTNGVWAQRVWMEDEGAVDFQPDDASDVWIFGRRVDYWIVHPKPIPTFT